MSHQTVLIFDFGTQYAQLIARRVRECMVYSRIVPCTMPAAAARKEAPVGIILSGGPASVYADGAPAIDPEIFEMGVPILGICYGAQLMARALGGRVERADRREFGRKILTVVKPGDLLEGLAGREDVWMSHGDQVESLPAGFEILGHTDTAPFAVFGSQARRMYGVQFHPEVTHTRRGSDILRNFLFRVCGAAGDWKIGDFIGETVSEIREKVGGARVICGLSGGVDSSVTAMLMHRAVGDCLTCIFVDNGVLRKGEFDSVQKTFRDHFHLPLVAVDARERFFKALAGVTDP
jgi:GMP synthase (glutamine-hydrolysing)